MPLSEEQFDKFWDAHEASRLVATAAIRFLQRVDNAYGDIPALRDFREEVHLVHVKFIAPDAREDFAPPLKAIPHLRVVQS